ncbi:hypothetical protein K4K57_011687 [Colletotrichum sp. SAR 10_99]|nr:hypothetical protein K4K57_011687 [Colletotrichum sp. SAR 10_99]
MKPAPDRAHYTALTEKSPAIWDAIIAYVGQGGTAIAASHFSSFVERDKIRLFSAKAGLNWESGDYRRTTVAFYAQIAGIAAEILPTQYSQKALFLKGVHPNAIVYGPNETSVTESRVFPSEKVTDCTQAAIRSTEVRNGKMGYFKDVNAEVETNDVILAMRELLV